MKKKLLFGMLLLSIFLFSSVTMVQPARGYEYGVPEAAKGMEGESEIRIYDKDEWEDHLGDGPEADEPTDIWDGQSDIVGARSKGRVVDWEEDDEIKFFWDFVLESDLSLDDPVTGEKDPLVDTYKDAIEYIYRTVTNVFGTSAIGGAASALTAINLGLTPITPNATWGLLGYLANNTLAKFLQGTLRETEAKLLYSKEWEGTMITTDGWNFRADADFPSEPDDDDEEGPFLADPRDLKESYDELIRLKTHVYGQLEDLSANGTLLYGAIMPPTGNIHMAIQLDQIMGGTGDLSVVGLALGTGIGGPLQVITDFEILIPKKAGYLYLALEGGLPVYTPVEDYLEKMVDEFRIDDEVEETGMPPIDGTIPIKCDVDVEGRVITMKFEYRDDFDDPYEVAKGELDPHHLEDWEVVFTYSEYGSQSMRQYKDGDDIFFEMGGVEQIPGYEVTIIIGVSALSIVGLIYVLMKKRKM
jgi:hypothetical protein